MTGYYIERGGKYLGAQGWTTAVEYALRFATSGDAEAGRNDMRKQSPSLVSGSEIVARDAAPEVHYGVQTHAPYHPFNGGTP
jgi:hypothetical protein